ncbi:cytochrome c [Urechidicola vernalis]|uniref:Cytochrome c n=1 Tax=Urechidicola vernalis TaxID=3075600 RepID=A0ABU2Y6M3_9FLAO|nr:cytochrome c [Urechidicola sp. P050]MDT0553848.1 cytochrome c [Urechidicola sp. P050]
MKKINLALVVFISIVYFSCSNDSTEDLNPPIPVDINYTNDIKPIMESHCNNCHGAPPTNGAPVSLTTYDEVKNETQNGELIDRIERPQGTAGVMPPGGSTLTSAQIQTIKDWMTEGFKE